MRVHRVVIGLIAGLIVGSAIAAWDSPVALRLVGLMEPIGQLWLNALRMTVLPLLVSLLFVDVAGARANRVGPLGLAILATYVGLLVLAAVLALLIGPPLMNDLHLSPDAAMGLRASASSAAGGLSRQVSQLPGLGTWFSSLVPANALKSAADGAMLPLIAFTLLFALAARRIDVALRSSLLAVFEAIAKAMQVVVGWIMTAAPVGVFALVVGIASQVGASLAGAMAYYVLACAAATTLFALLIYPVASTLGGVPLPRFVRAVFPAQVVAISSSSSLASLPALIQGAQALELPAPITGLVLPLSVSVFKVATPITWVVGTLFIAKLYGIAFGAMAALAIAVSSIAFSLAIPGVPQGAMLVLATLASSFGVPAAGTALLIGADSIPDLFATMTNVTGDLVAATLVARRAPEPSVADDPAAAASSVDA